MPKLSDEQKQQHLSIRGIRCPYCGSDDIQGESWRSTKAKLHKKSIATTATASGTTSTPCVHASPPGGLLLPAMCCPAPPRSAAQR